MKATRLATLTVISGILLALTTPCVLAQEDSATSAAEQDAKSVSAAIEKDAKDVLGDRAQPPDLSKDTSPTGVQQSGNAGRANISQQSSGNNETETVTRSSEHSSSFSVGMGRDDRGNDDRSNDGHRDDPFAGDRGDARSRQPVAGEIANQPPPPRGWPGHDGANRPSNTSEVANYDAGPIWNNNDAQGKCPNVCDRNQRVWTGEWRTVGFNKSVCTCAVGGYAQSSQSDWGRGSSCHAPANYQCRGCSVSCPAGKSAHCTQGDRGIFNKPDSVNCGTDAVCDCR